MTKCCMMLKTSRRNDMENLRPPNINYGIHLHNRPNKLSKGVMKTLSRDRRKNSPAKWNLTTMSLAFRGTTDVLRSLSQNKTEAVLCPCCGAETTKIKLNGLGRQRLLILRLKRNKSIFSKILEKSAEYVRIS